MILVASLLLAASPVHVVAVHGPKTEATLARLVKTSSGAIDASELHAYLLRPPSTALMQEFEGFSAAPIPQWPSTAADVWTLGMAHCHSVAGPPPWSPSKQSTAMACGTRLATYLWQQYATLQRASRVFEIDVVVDERRGKVEVRGSMWEPTSRDVLYFEEYGPVAKQDALLEQIVSALIANQGKTRARNVVSELASAVLGDPFAGQAVASSPVDLAKTCAALPRRLTFTQKGILVDSLTARWKPADAKGESLPCTLNYNEHTESGGSQVNTIMTTLMTCSSYVVTAELARDAGAAQKRALVDLVSEKLVQNLATKLCK